MNINFYHADQDMWRNDKPHENTQNNVNQDQAN